MQLSDFPFDKDIPSFPSHTQMLEYLEQYTAHFEVSDYERGVEWSMTVECIQISEVVQLGCHVERIESVQTADKSLKVCLHWKKQNKSMVGTFDKVVICNGHFAKPAYPTIRGMHFFEGMQVHSHDYRTPKLYENKSILLIGKGPSGDDISKELVNCGAKEVIVSYPRYNTSDRDSNLEDASQTSEKRLLKPPIQYIDHDKTFVFQDGTQCAAPDVIMYCTGYQYTVMDLVPDGLLFPNSKAADGFSSTMQKSAQFRSIMEEAANGKVVAPLYEHILSIQNPNIAFVGLPSKVVPFLCFELQAKWLSAVYKGDLKFTKSEMIQQFWNQVMQSESAMRKFHVLGTMQPAYMRFVPIQDAVPAIHTTVFQKARNAKQHNTR